MIRIIRLRKIWFILSSSLVIASIVFIAVFGLKLGIDFTGGSLMEITFNTELVPLPEQITNSLTELNIGPVSAQKIGTNNVLIRLKDIDEKTHQDIVSKLNQTFNTTIIENRFDSVGPSIGQELQYKTIIAVIIASLVIIVYIAWVFRKVSKPVASWKYGVMAVIALIHDVTITTGAFALFNKLYGIEIDATFIAAILTILGYSVNDTIVVFDRIRENLAKHLEDDFELTVEKSINETLVRSINTSFTVILTLFAILIFGGDSIRNFALALIIGITIGTYSSIFLASPLLVEANKLLKK